MHVAYLYSGDDGESHFGALDLPLHAEPSGASVTEFFAAEGVQFRFGRVQTLDFHPAPRRQFLLFLSGQQEYAVADGTRQAFGPGDYLLVDDTEGHGHISHRTTAGLSVWVSVPKSLDLSRWRTA